MDESDIDSEGEEEMTNNLDWPEPSYNGMYWNLCGWMAVNVKPIHAHAFSGEH